MNGSSVECGGVQDSVVLGTVFGGLAEGKCVWRAAEQAGVFAQSLKAHSLCARRSVAAQRVSQA
jgi:hypothetical protein